MGGDNSGLFVLLSLSPSLSPSSPFCSRQAFHLLLCFGLQADEDLVGPRLEATDEVENVTRSSLALVPSLEDDGEKITCRAENPWVPRSFVEDSWVLHVVCKTTINLTQVSEE
jgi:hypothetical protein